MLTGKEGFYDRISVHNFCTPSALDFHHLYFSSSCLAVEIMRPTRRDSALSLLAQSPHGWSDPAVEKAASRKPRKGGRQEETSAMHRMCGAFRHYFRAAWPVGSIWLARNNNGRVKRGNAWFNYGLGTGTHDYIGFTSIVITPEMIGRRIAVFTSVEGKKDRDCKLDKNQQTFADAVTASGGYVVEPFASEEQPLVLVMRKQGVPV